MALAARVDSCARVGGSTGIETGGARGEYREGRGERGERESRGGERESSACSSTIQCSDSVAHRLEVDVFRWNNLFTT